MGVSLVARAARMGLGLAWVGVLLSACQPADPNPAASASSHAVANAPTVAEAPSARQPASSPLPASPAAKAPAANAELVSAAPEAPSQEAVLGLLAASAGLHALGEHCGLLQANARSDAIASLKTRWVGEGSQRIRAEAFDGAYQASYAETQRRIAAQPERAKQACSELPALEQQAHKALLAMGKVTP